MSTLLHVFNILCLINLVYSQCDDNTLVLDDSYQQMCNIGCSECLKYMHIDLIALTMRASSLDATTCSCLSYTLELNKNNHFNIYDDRLNMVGNISLNNEQTYIKIMWSNWMGVQIDDVCRQYYVPNIDDFMTISSYQAFTITTTFDVGAHEVQNDKTLYFNFITNITNYLSDIFNITSFTAQMIHTSVNPQSYKMDIKSGNNLGSIVIDKLESIYNERSSEINTNVKRIISNIFSVNISYFNNFMSSTAYIRASSENKCDTYFETTKTKETTETTDADNDSSHAIIISFCVVAGFLLIIAILLLICYKRHILCFKQKWSVIKSVDYDDDVAVTKNKTDIRTSIEENTELINQINHFQTEQDKLLSKYEELKQKYQEMKNKYTEIQQENEEKQIVIQVLEQQNKNLEDKNKYLQQENEKLMTNNTDSTKQSESSQIDTEQFYDPFGQQIRVKDEYGLYKTLPPIFTHQHIVTRDSEEKVTMDNKTWKKVEFDANSFVIMIGDKEFMALEVEEIENKEEIIYFENKSEKIEIICQDSKHANCLKEKMEVLKKYALKKQNKERQKAMDYGGDTNSIYYSSDKRIRILDEYGVYHTLDYIFRPEQIMTRGHPFDHDYFDKKLKLNNETWENVEFDKKSKKIKIGDKEFVPTEIENIEKDEETIYIEDKSGKTEIRCNDIKHAKWFKEKADAFKQYGLKQKNKDKQNVKEH